MTTSKISWATKSWNPARGCLPVSPGCDNCWASALANRFMSPTSPFEGLLDENGKWNGQTRFDIKTLVEPRHWRKAQRVFVCSMSDLFYSGHSFRNIRSVLSIMIGCPQHVFMVLTKRAHRMNEFMSDPDNMVYRHWPHIWFGVTVENQAQADFRVPRLLDIPGIKRFVSCEPLLEEVTLRDFTKHLDWVIAGGESGPGFREPDTGTVDGPFRLLRDECKGRCPFHFKQHPGPRPGHEPELDGKIYHWVPPLPGEDR